MCQKCCKIASREAHSHTQVPRFKARGILKQKAFQVSSIENYVTVTLRLTRQHAAQVTCIQDASNIWLEFQSIQLVSLTFTVCFFDKCAII